MMNEKQMKQWAKWHERGYGVYMIAHLAMVLGFFAFTGTIAYVQLFTAMPESIKEGGGGVPILPAVLVIGIMVPLSGVFSHLQWKRKESQFVECQGEEEE